MILPVSMAWFCQGGYGSVRRFCILNFEHVSPQLPRYNSLASLVRISIITLMILFILSNISNDRLFLCIAVLVAKFPLLQNNWKYLFPCVETKLDLSVSGANRDRHSDSCLYTC